MNNRIKSHLLKIRHAIEKARSQWLDKAMAKVLPENIYTDSLSDDGPGRMRAAKYMSVNNIRLVEEPEKVSLVVGDRVVSELVVRVEAGRLKVITRDNPPPPKASEETASN